MSKTLKILIPIVCAVLLIIVLAGSLVVTQANEYTIIRQFGAVVRIIDQPGLSLKTPFVQSASTLPKTEMLYDLAVSDVITSDKKSMVADSFVLWRIDDPLKFIQTLSGSVATAESRLDQPENRHQLHEAGGGHFRARRRACQRDHGKSPQDQQF